MSVDRDLGNTRAGRELRAELDRLSFDEVVAEIGEPDEIQTKYYDHPWYRPGDGRPLLATEDIAVTQGMSRCLTWRAAPAIANLTLPIHPGTCNWCDYPDDELRKAIGWASFMSRFIADERAVWRGSRGRYLRTTERAGKYENPAWADWFAPIAGGQQRMTEAAIHHAMYG